jgi:ABC-type nitrate/sulfonate/bicarbonate transport system substrate-binding protein
MVFRSDVPSISVIVFSMKFDLARRRVLFGGFGCLTLAAQSQAAETVITISHPGLVGGAGDALLIPIALNQNLFARHGLSANLVRGALEQGEVAVFGSPAVLQSIARGLDLKIVAAFGSGRLFSRLVSRPAIKSAQDLRGKVLGANGVGAGNWTMSILALERLGLDQKRDEITIRSTGDTLATAKALREGTIDAALLSSGLSQELVSQGYSVLLDLGAFEVFGPQLVLATRSKFLRDRQSAVSNVVSALVESCAFMLAPRNREQFQTEFTKAFGVTTPASLDQAYQDLRNLNRLPFPSRDRLLNIQRLMALNQAEIGRLDLSDVIQDGVVHELVQRGDIAAIYEKYGVKL